MPIFCLKAQRAFRLSLAQKVLVGSGRGLRRGAHNRILLAMLGQPTPGYARVLLARMEVGAQVVAPRFVGQPDQATFSEQVRGRAFPCAPFPERAVAAQV